MLNGPELGAAVAEAIRLKGVTKAAVARHFGIKGPSIYDWINHGRVGKQHLTELVDYFSDVVGPEHWGMEKGFGHSSSHVQRLSAPIILRAIQLMREATRKLEGQPVDVEADPELFAAMLQLAILEPKEDASNGERVRAAGGPGGRAVGATREAEDGAAARAAPSRARKRA